MNFDEMKQAISQARSTFNLADSMASTLADLLVGRLRMVSSWTLVKLKRELRNFNAHTKTWKN